MRISLDYILGKYVSGETVDLREIRSSVKKEFDFPDEIPLNQRKRYEGRCIGYGESVLYIVTENKSIRMIRIIGSTIMNK